MVGVRIAKLAHEFDGRMVFDGVDFEFEGSCLAVTGPNGSGKSTLLRILAGLLTPISGEAGFVVDGAAMPREAIQSAVGLAAPDVRLYAELSARENLRFLLRARGAARRPRTTSPEGAAQRPRTTRGTPGDGNIEERVDQAVTEVGLADRADDPVGELSSGLRQRAALAAAIAHDPRVLLLDEPSSNLDEAGVQILREMIEARRKGGLVVIATNDADEAAVAEARLQL